MINFEHLKRIDYVEQFGDVKMQMCALFDDRCISEEEVNKVIKSGATHNGVIIVMKSQFKNVFLFETE
jgi:hypothetical protein